MAQDRPIAANPLSNRAFGLTLCVVFAIISGIAWLVFDHLLEWAVATSATFLLVALILPGVLLPLNRLWLRVAHRIGQLNNFVLLTLLYGLIVMPIALLLRLFGWDALNRAQDGDAKSYFVPVQQRATTDLSSDMF